MAKMLLASKKNGTEGAVRPILDLVADQEIVHQEANPAERHHGDRQEDFVEGLKLVVLEDVEHAPHGGDDARDVNDGSDHNDIEFKG